MHAMGARGIRNVKHPALSRTHRATEPFENCGSNAQLLGSIIQGQYKQGREILKSDVTCALQQVQQNRSNL